MVCDETCSCRFIHSCGSDTPHLPPPQPPAPAFIAAGNYTAPSVGYVRFIGHARFIEVDAAFRRDKINFEKDWRGTVRSILTSPIVVYSDQAVTAVEPLEAFWTTHQITSMLFDKGVADLWNGKSQAEWESRCHRKDLDLVDRVFAYSMANYRQASARSASWNVVPRAIHTWTISQIGFYYGFEG